jgi:UDP-N-acetylglucosamine 2-epimerase (non-hydrolysing)
MKKSVLVVLGTRPEAIKLAVVIRELMASESLRPIVCTTGQHRELVDQVVSAFDLPIHHDLKIMTPRQSLDQITSRALEGVARVLAETAPQYLLVQGDTTTAFAAALAAFYAGVPVGHVEAGLRTADARNPFPEEMNRRLVTQLATDHFAPTESARHNLRAAGVSESRILVTGNTVVDACLWMRSKLGKRSQDLPVAGLSNGHRSWILVTMHRRESWGQPMQEVCEAMIDILESDPNLHILFPVHPNPVVQEVVYPTLGKHARAHLVEPLAYSEFLGALSVARLVLTDSGGVQEEVASFGKPTVILRKDTERPEVVDSGFGVLAGTDKKRIIQNSLQLLREWRVPETGNPFGDGRASERIVEHVNRFLLRE